MVIHDSQWHIQFLGLGGEMSVGCVSCLVSGSPGQIAGARDNIEKSDPPSPHMSPLPGLSEPELLSALTAGTGRLRHRSQFAAHSLT